MAKPDKKLFLLDAYALIYRAHFAFSKNVRISSRGLNTGVMFGFTNTLLEVLTKQQPTHIGVAFDTSEPTFRHQEFEAYKANRQEVPEDITIGVPWVKKILAGFNIPILEKPGFEADDIIGTLAWKAAEAGFEVFMMTPDKDFGQLVREHVYLYKPSYMGSGVDILGEAEVLKKWGIKRVDQVADMLGLQGDSSDNIPGIPGIGPKTATKLLDTYDTVENLVLHAKELKGKQRENIENFGEQGILSKKLATIITDVPIEFDASALEYHGPDPEKLKPIFEELEFRTLARRVFSETTGDEAGQLDIFSSSAAEIAEEQAPAEKSTLANTEHLYHMVDTPELCRELAEFLNRQKEFCFDTETTSLDPLNADMVGISFCYHPGEAYYVPLPAEKKAVMEVLEYFRPALESKNIVKIAQNIKYDMLVLRSYGIEVQPPIYDTMLAHYLLEPETKHSMDAMAEAYLNYAPVSIESLIGKKGGKQGSMRDVPLAEIKEYAAEDADITFQLKKILEKELTAKPLQSLLQDMELPLVQVLASMEYEGVRLDTQALADMSKELDQESLKVEKDIFGLCGTEFNIASPKQLGEVLFDRMKLVDKPKKTKSGQYATGEEILSRLAEKHEIARLILDYREYQKLKSTYVDALPALIDTRDGRVHTTYSQAVAATGRLSSINPNLQNIPIRTAKGREIRKAFIPRDEEHVLLAADYSQIELRIMAAFSEDESMIEAFRKGQDIHATTAGKIYHVPLEQVDADMRRKAKTANFGIIYGISAFGLSQRLNIPRSEAAEIIAAYFEQFPAVKTYMDRVIQEAREKGYVETAFGRRRYLRDINSQNATMRGYAERNAINAPIQGTAADIIKRSMINIYDWITSEKLKTRMILQVHDELVFDVYKSELDQVREKVSKLMSEASPLEVPMVVETGVGNNWLEAH